MRLRPRKAWVPAQDALSYVTRRHPSEFGIGSHTCCPGAEAGRLGPLTTVEVQGIPVKRNSHEQSSTGFGCTGRPYCQRVNYFATRTH